MSICSHGDICLNLAVRCFSKLWGYLVKKGAIQKVPEQGELLLREKYLYLSHFVIYVKFLSFFCLKY